MFDVSTFKELYAYNLFANTLTIQQVLTTTAPQNAKAVRLMGHILNAQTIWNSRMMGVAQPFGPWQEQDPKIFETMMQREHEITLRILETKSLQSTLSYTNSLGNTYTNTFEQVLFHVINHSTYHRAQIASDVKAQGLTPAVTDYIAYKR